MYKLLFTLFFAALVYGGQAQIIHTIAGNGTTGYTGDGGQATAAGIDESYGIARDAAGNLYISEWSVGVIRMMNTAGIISTIVGNGSLGFGGDGGPATAAQISSAYSIAADPAGNLYIADYDNDRIRKVSAAGTITTIAGTGTSGFSGDGGPATAALLSEPWGIGVDHAGNVYFSDAGNLRIRKIDAAGIITTVIGTGVSGFTGDGGPATAARIGRVYGIAFNSANDVFFADINNHRIRTVNSAGIISTFAGTGAMGFSGDGGPATAAQMSYPGGIAFDTSDNFYFSGNDRVRMINAAGTVATIAGTGVSGFSGDGGPATAATFNTPDGLVAISPAYIYICDANNARVRRITPSVTTQLTGHVYHEETITVFPNPSSGEFTLQLPPGMKGMVSVTITDATGETVCNTILPAGAAAKLSPQLPAGLYTIRTSQGTHEWKARLVIQK